MFGWFAQSKPPVVRECSRIVDVDDHSCDSDDEAHVDPIPSAVDTLNQHIARHFSDDAVAAIKELRKHSALSTAVRTALPLFCVRLHTTK